MDSHGSEVVDAELVDDDLLPATIQPHPPAARPVVDRHTVLYPGQALPTEADQPTYTERDIRVSERTQQRLETQSAPKNTSANYKSQRNLFATWCTEQGRVARPCTTATYVEYVAHLIEAGRSPNAISAAMSAIRTWMPEDKKPGTKQARGMLNEYKKEWAKRTAVRKAPPVTDALLRAMVASCDLTTPAGVRDRCMLLLGRGALNRRIELADLSIADVAVDDDFVTLHIRSSKTDQEAKGEHTDIPADPDPLLDPVAAVRDWLTALHHLGVREGAFFRALTSRGTLQNRAVAKERGDYVTGDAINDWVRSRAHKAGAKNWQQITAHGLRRGGAQAIAEAGGDPTKQGRWKADSAVVKREYLDRAQSRAENPWLKVQAKRRKEPA
ncbi:tyrosine-type recombinase/integrase (plasmid) [Streptomyces sp. NBC_01590]|uniref:tyrosine-type recombinase/integrase n=1 Tax=Streptomyces sp. NBC_01590 TaxID=2975887 RepID=UPI002F90FC34